MPAPSVILIAVGVLAALYAVWIFNRLISLNVRAANAWSDIDVQLKRRADLVPSLVQTVRGYAAHEMSTLQGVVQMRAGNNQVGVAQRAQQETQVAREIHRLIAVAEAYPNLKADQMFLSLHRQLVEVEDHLQSTRRYYNAVVRDFNTLLHQFPHSIIAAVLRFRPREFFDATDADAAVPLIDLQGRSA
jgi:LemA protein